MIVIILFGKPSEGGSGGVPYLPDFWTAIGLYLPLRNAYVLLRKAVCFDGHGTAQALLILLAYLVVFGECSACWITTIGALRNSR